MLRFRKPLWMYPSFLRLHRLAFLVDSELGQDAT